MRPLRTAKYLVGFPVLGSLVGGAAGWLVTAHPKHEAPPGATTVEEPKELALPPASGEVTLALVGDVLLYGPVEKSIGKYGARFPFAHVADRLRRADVAFCNLECPLTTVSSPTPLKFRSKRLMRNEFIFRAAPDTAASLAHGGIDVVSLANNHLMDHGVAGIRDTLTALEEYGIAHCGGGTNLADARRHALLEVRGTRLAFLAYCWDGTLPGTRHFAAGNGTPGIVFVHTNADGSPTVSTTNMVREDIRRAKKDAHFVLVSHHWGPECRREPNVHQRELAHLTAEAGADLVVGHHPHCLQGVEMHGDTPLLYSLGNFVFRSRALLTRQTAVAEVELSDGKLTELSLHPIMIDDTQPRPPSAPEAKAVCVALTSLSEGLNTPSRSVKSGGALLCQMAVSKRDRAELLYARGLSLKRKGQPAAAVACFQEAKALGQPPADIHHALGWTFAGLGKAAYARDHFEKLLAVEPEGKRADEAVAALERLRARSPL